MSNYEEMADAFAKKYGVKLSILRMSHGKHFADDKYERYIFKCRLSRGRKSYTFHFGQSIAKGATEPTMYEVLSCLTKDDPGTFVNFCNEFGYDYDSRSAERIWKGCVKEYNAVVRLFGKDGECMDELWEIN